MESRRRYAPIRFVDMDGRDVEDPCVIDQGNCLPVLAVRLVPAGSQDNGGSPCLALLDTGCDYTHVAPEMLDTVRGRLVREVSTAGVTGSLETSAFDCTLIIPLNDGNVVAAATDAIRSPGLSGRPYAVLLGRSLLRHGRLVMDYKDRIFRLYLE